MLLPNIKDKDELLYHIEQSLLFENLLRQLNKDFEIIGIPINFLDSKSPFELIEFLENIISELIQKQFADFLNILYRIDINENQIKTIINQNNNNIEQKITFLILKREWQKVWFRKNYLEK